MLDPKIKHNKIGKVYGKLTVLKFAGWKLQVTKQRPEGRVSTWLCECSCANKTQIIVASTYLLNKKGVRSCGCLHQETHKRGSQSPRAIEHGLAAFNSVYSQYKYGAKKRGYSFELSKNEFREITQKECFYCGDEKTCCRGESGKKYNFNGSFSFNGIDRVDSSLGYTLANSVPCCITCNEMKNNLSLQEFIKHIKLIAIHNGIA